MGTVSKPNVLTGTMRVNIGESVWVWVNKENKWELASDQSTLPSSGCRVSAHVFDDELPGYAAGACFTYPDVPEKHNGRRYWTTTTLMPGGMWQKVLGDTVRECDVLREIDALREIEEAKGKDARETLDDVYKKALRSQEELRTEFDNLSKGILGEEMADKLTYLFIVYFVDIQTKEASKGYRVVAENGTVASMKAAAKRARQYRDWDVEECSVVINKVGNVDLE